MTSPKLYIDEDAAEQAVVTALGRHGIDIQTAYEVGLSAAHDDEQLRFAAESGRVLYTLNVNDFARLHRDYQNRGEEHAGIILIPRQRYSIGEKARRLTELLVTSTAESLRKTINFL